jgi:hypothetical protein
VKVEDDEGRVPLLREHERPDHQGPVPLIFDLIDDPVEEWDLLNKTVLVGWVVEPVAKRLGALQRSMSEYPKVQPGQDFTGYPAGEATREETSPG